ncbi:MAG: M3 family oligoendopeptidase [Lachnospiraceae bacterium]|nr:M3 family oligoendopeptidase [Lachnospiraceae bacterium]
MNSEWSLDVFYKGVSDPRLDADMAKLEEMAETYKQMITDLPQVKSGEQPDSGELIRILKEVVLVKEELTVLSRKLGGYFSLRRSTDSSDSEGSRYSTRIRAISAGLSTYHVAFDKFAGSIENLETLLQQDDVLKEYTFYFSEIKDSVSHLLSDEAEGVIAKMNISGGSTWSELVGYLQSRVKVDYKGEIITLPAVRGLAADEDPAVRKAAYEAEIRSYDQIKDPIAFALNAIKTQVNTTSELHGYADPMELTLKDSRMKRETLDALLQAIQDYLPRFRSYLSHKAKLLGHENGLPWYDILAPMGEASSRKFTIEEAREYLLEQFSPFAEDIASMIDTAFEDNWIDFYPRNGKRGGAFCANIPFAGQSRILTNFTGEFGDVVTLAHELGHAYHGTQIQDHRPLNWNYSMPVAETASNFNELVVMNEAISKAKGQEKIRLVESQIQDCTQIIVDILSRYLFEDAVFHQSKERFLYADDLAQLMLDAQKQAFGEGLDEKVLHPYMWCCKSHYYSAGRSYYNFPYAFGGLFSRGIYARYLEEGKSFLPRYREMLKATTVASCEDVAKIAGIDLTDVGFWRSSLQVIDDNIRIFMA